MRLQSSERDVSHRVSVEERSGMTEAGAFKWAAAGVM